VDLIDESDAYIQDNRDDREAIRSLNPCGLRMKAWPMLGSLEVSSDCLSTDVGKDGKTYS